jgi:hypothetical protein
MSTVVNDTECEVDCSIDVGSTAPSASGRKVGATPRDNPERHLEAECHAVVEVVLEFWVEVEGWKISRQKLNSRSTSVRFADELSVECGG